MHSFFSSTHRFNNPPCVYCSHDLHLNSPFQYYTHIIITHETQREAEHHIWALRRHWIGFSSLWISLLSSLPTSNWVLFARRKSTPGGTQSLPASDWVLFLVDFFGGHGLLFLKTSIRVGEEWIKEKEKGKKKRDS